jgi:surface-anchored protein
MKSIQCFGRALAGALAITPIALAFAEIPRLVDDHVDLRVLYDPDRTPPLELVVREADQRLIYRSEEVILVAQEKAQITLPPGLELFGDAGDFLWVLPQSPDDQLLYLGASGEGLPPQLFTGGLNLQLRAIEAPGHFFVWQATQFGDLALHINSRDGIDSSDRLPLRAGGHDHYNWGFTAPGVYTVVFQVTGHLPGQLEPVSSAQTPITFHVLALPGAGVSPQLIADGFNEQGLFQLRVRATPGRTYRLETSPDLEWWQTLTTLAMSSDETIFTDPSGVEARRYYRIAGPSPTNP